ncbi:MAG: hypothetical protein IJW48_01725 [Clostridia bacterium]|nr:hypothetical protein [Clostridia bacterium]
MKTQKIFLLAVALVLALSVLASCGAAKQAYPDCFVFVDDDPSFTEPVEVEGEIIDVNEEYNLVAFETRSLGTDGYSRRTVKVIDVSDENRVVFTREQSFSADSTGKEDEINLDDYPVIKVTSHSFQGYDDGYPEYKDYYSYYLIQKNGEARSLKNSTDKDELYVEQINNVWLVEDGETLYWVNKNLAVMREMPLAVAETYRGSNYESYFRFEAEYNDYLYTWEFDADNLSQVVVVYDPNGIACAKYAFPTGMYLGNPFVSVLDNGNVIIQEQTVAEDGEAYDYVYGYGPTSYNVDVVTKVMNYQTGEVTEVEFDYLVSFTSSRYEMEQQTYPEIYLAEGYNNMAIVTAIEDGTLGRNMTIVVISNELEIQWKLENEHLTLPTMIYVGEDGYIAEAVVDGATRTCRFTWDGELVHVFPANFDYERMTSDVYVTDSGVYTLDGELVFDIENSDFYNAGVYIVGECIYFTRENDLKLGEWNDYYEEYEEFVEFYKLNLETGEAELIADGEETFCEPFTEDGALGVINEKKGTITVYNAAGEIVLVTKGEDIVETYTSEGAFIIEVEVGDEHKFYVFGLGDQCVDNTSANMY